MYDAQKKYDAENTIQIKLKLNMKTDADIVAKLDNVWNKQGYIKELIRKDLEDDKTYIEYRLLKFENEADETYLRDLKPGVSLDIGDARGFDDPEILQKFSSKKEAYETFCRENGFWLDDFALFMTIKNLNGGKAWTEWDSALRNREKEALELVRARQEGEIAFWKILQFFFFRQWKALHNYCAGKNIRIIGDMPFYVALDSVDVWARPDLFLLDEERIPIEVAGVPPDGFSETGQLWGNPVYRWEEHKKTGYSWWIQKIGYLCREYDILRIDHFRGFDSYYTVKYGSEDARGGAWRPGPGYALFEALKKSRGDLPIIAEDLGYTTESVRKLLKDTGFPGMKILQFGFDERDEGSSDHLPHQYPVHCVAYTGTHDNDTLCGWLEHADPGDVACARDYLRLEGAKEPHWDMIKALYATAAETVIVQTQDLLGLDSESRMNTPSTMGGNWCWRLCQGDLNKELAEKLRHITSLYDRMNRS